MKLYFETSKLKRNYLKTKDDILLVVGDESEADELHVFHTEDSDYIRIHNMNTGKYLHITSDKITWSDEEKNVRHNFCHTSQNYMLQSEDAKTYIVVSRDQEVIPHNEVGLNCYFERSQPPFTVHENK